MNINLDEIMIMNFIYNFRKSRIVDVFFDVDYDFEKIFNMFIVDVTSLNIDRNANLFFSIINYSDFFQYFLFEFFRTLQHDDVIFKCNLLIDNSKKIKKNEKKKIQNRKK